MTSKSCSFILFMMAGMRLPIKVLHEMLAARKNIRYMRRLFRDLVECVRRDIDAKFFCDGNKRAGRYL